MPSELALSSLFCTMATQATSMPTIVEDQDSVKHKGRTDTHSFWKEKNRVLEDLKSGRRHRLVLPEEISTATERTIRDNPKRPSTAYTGCLEDVMTENEKDTHWIGQQINLALPAASSENSSSKSRRSKVSSSKIPDRGGQARRTGETSRHR